MIAGAVTIGAVALGASWLAGPRASLPGPEASIGSGTPAPFEPNPSSTAARSRIGLPDPRRTPGSINPNVSQANIDSTICKSGWTATVRPPSAYASALKVVQILEYGYADKKPSDYQEDHLVALELGGAPRDPANLWPEPNAVVLADGSHVGSAAKDGLENYLHAQVCARSKLLADAQRLIAGDWIAAWESADRP